MAAVCVVLSLVFVILAIAGAVHLLHLLFAGGRRENWFRGSECPNCAARVEAGSIYCPKCAFYLGERMVATLEDELEATIRQVSRLAASGRISDSLRREFLDAVGADIADRGGKGAPGVASANVRAPRAAADVARPETPEAAAPPPEPPAAVAKQSFEKRVPKQSLGTRCRRTCAGIKPLAPSPPFRRSLRRPRTNGPTRSR